MLRRSFASVVAFSIAETVQAGVHFTPVDNGHYVNENAGVAHISVTSDAPTTVHYEAFEWIYPGFIDYPATGGVDFQPVSGTLTFGPGETGKTFDIPIIDDPDWEYPETIGIKLSDATNGVAVDTSTYSVTILNDDARCLVSLQPIPPISEASLPLTITLTRTGNTLG